MKNQYVADIGDYGKYSLLKAFLDAGIKVGINWYLTDDDGTNDGKFTRYLEDVSKTSLRKYNPNIFDELKQINYSNRTIQSVENSAFLSGTFFYNSKVPFSNIQQEQRRKWHRAAVKQLEDAELVFLDPDNGLRKDDRNSRSADKYVFAEEISSYYSTQNVVFYCHKGRRTSEEWERYKSTMPKMLPSSKPIVLTYHRGTQRSYIFLIHPKDYDNYRKIINAFLKKWEGIFTEESIKDPDVHKYYSFATKWVDFFKKEEGFCWIFESNDFVNDARTAGCVMDAQHAFFEVFPESKAFRSTDELKQLLETDTRVTAPLLGEMIFSMWRYYNHWAYSSPEDWVKEWFIIALEHLADMTKRSC